jgi:glutamine amidotransferase
VTRVALVDYGAGNVDSAGRALEECGADVVLASTPAALERAQAIVLPGVGAFGDGVRGLQERGLVEPLRAHVRERGRPLLGVCLGMQLLADASDEGGTDVQGLGLVPGRVVRLAAEPGERVPHVGWNEVHATRPSPLLAPLADGTDFYFVHSFHLRPDDPADAVATTPYAGGFVSAVGRGTAWGVQFHPEKSQRAGFALLRGFLAEAGAC